MRAIFVGATALASAAGLSTVDIQPATMGTDVAACKISGDVASVIDGKTGAIKLQALLSKASNSGVAVEAPVEIKVEGDKCLTQSVGNQNPDSVIAYKIV